jgi:hypothetical protein
MMLVPEVCDSVPEMVLPEASLTAMTLFVQSTEAVPPGISVVSTFDTRNDIGVDVEGESSCDAPDEDCTLTLLATGIEVSATLKE